MDESLGRESLGADSDWEIPSRYYYTLKEAQQQVGAGWGKLLADIYSMLPVGSGVLQVKEKWGRLDISVSNTDDNWFFEHLAYTRSATICEICGRKGKSRPTGWIKTLCWQHYYTFVVQKLWETIIIRLFGRK